MEHLEATKSAIWIPLIFFESCSMYNVTLSSSSLSISELYVSSFSFLKIPWSKKPLAENVNHQYCFQVVELMHCRKIS